MENANQRAKAKVKESVGIVAKQGIDHSNVLARQKEAKGKEKEEKEKEMKAKEVKEKEKEKDTVAEKPESVKNVEK